MCLVHWCVIDVVMMPLIARFRNIGYQCVAMNEPKKSCLESNRAHVIIVLVAFLTILPLQDISVMPMGDNAHDANSCCVFFVVTCFGLLNSEFPNDPLLIVQSYFQIMEDVADTVCADYDTPPPQSLS